MKKIAVWTVAILAFVTVSLNINAQTNPTEEAVKNLEAYPATMDSLERYVIFVDQQADERLFEVELIAGKVLEVDCNNQRLMGSFSEEIVQGWGYNYYVFETEGQVMSTMMFCPESKVEKFVSGQSLTVRYNSRLPIVVYLPKGYDLKYKIWTAGEEQAAERK